MNEGNVAKDLLEQTKQSQRWMEEQEERRARDMFAASAVNGMLASGQWDIYDSRLAERAYFHADQMLAERDRIKHTS